MLEKCINSRQELNGSSHPLLEECGEYCLDSINLDSELVRYATKDVNLSKQSEAVLELYSRLCTVFRYDTETFLSLDNACKLRECDEKHKNVSYINTLGLENRQIICSDFAILFAKLVHHMCPESKLFMGIRDTGMPGGVNHSYCAVKTDTDNYTAFDPLKNFTNSDFLRTKLGLPVLAAKTENPGDEDIYGRYLRIASANGVSLSINTLRSDLMKYNLPPVEAASFTKGALRAASSIYGAKIEVVHGCDDNRLRSTYKLSVVGRATSTLILCDNTLKEVTG